MPVNQSNPQPSTVTWIRTVVLAITLMNQLLVSLNRAPLPFDDAETYEYVSIMATIFVSLWTYWKNNSWTKPAIEGDRVKDKLKAEESIQNKEPY